MTTPLKSSTEQTPSLDNLLAITYIIYGLHLFSAMTGLITSAFIVTAFLTGWPSIIAVLLNYLKQDDVRGTYLESHFRWQIRTFWYAVFWFFIAAILFITVLGIPAAIIIAISAGIWVLYRMFRGVLRLMNGKGMPI